MRFTFADLCCGIGGFHIACVANGGTCVQACDIDSFARQVYQENYGIVPDTDVHKIVPTTRSLDLVCFGNPCQSFSSIGKRQGLRDKRGKVFYAICKYLKVTNAGAFLMENVKGLLYLNGQADFNKMLNELKKLGYAISYAVLNATDFGVPQARERVYVIGHKNSRKNPFDFSMIVKTPKVNVLTPFLDKGRYAPYLLSKRFDMFDLNTVPPAPTRSGFIIKAEHGPYTEKKLFSSKGTIGTIMSSFSPFIYDERYKVVRNMSITEILRCQSFPAAFAFPPGISRSKALKYVGNAVCVNVVSALVHAMKLQGIIPF